MKVAHILNKIEFSGAEIMLYQAAGVFGDHNIETTLVTSEKEPGQFEQAMRDIGYAVDTVGAGSTKDYFKNLYKYFNANKFDVVHIHTERFYLWKVITIKLTGHHNIIRTFHNCWTFKGMLLHKRRLHRRIATWLGVKKQAIGPSAYKNEKEHFLNETTIINNWIELKPELLPKKDNIRKSKREELGIKPGSYVIISIGGCSPVKNHAFIIDLLKTLTDEGLGITYLHVGTGVDEEAEKVMVKEIGLNSQVIFTGNRKDVPELLICSDVFIMPSIFEGLSNARVEAMYYNGLVILNDVPGLTDMMVKDENGFIIDIKNKQAYIKLIRELYNNEIDVAGMKAAARKCVEENFGVTKNVNRLIGLYKQGTKLN